MMQFLNTLYIVNLKIYVISLINCIFNIYNYKIWKVIVKQQFVS